jgi:acyl-CoA synthetase (AMP-forming)/AMP-acid ligase II
VFINKVYEKYIEEYEEIRFKIVDNGDTYEHGLNDILQAEEMDDEEVKVDEHNDLAQIIYTSGTTGKPKGVMLTHLNIRSNTESIVEYLKLTSEDKIMVVLPFFYSYGNSLLLTHIKVGGTLVISEQFVFLNKVLELMIKEKVTGFAGVPSSYALLLYKSNIRNLKFPDLRYFTCAGGALPPSNIVELKSIFPDVEYYAMYGQTEATARLSYLEPDKWREKLGSAGKAIPGVSLKIKDKNGREVKPGEVGEIVAQGLNIMKGYWGEPEETKKVLKEDGLHTGDMAKIDEEGYIFIVGRQSDMIKSGAFRIHPQEIEEIIMEIPGIAECAVVGVPDEIMGEVIKAFVVLDKNVSIEERDILRCCKMNLPEYKMPKSVKFIEELPKTRSGKIKRYVLKSMND